MTERHLLAYFLIAAMLAVAMFVIRRLRREANRARGDTRIDLFGHR